jgi:hypothetical protein
MKEETMTRQKNPEIASNDQTATLETDTFDPARLRLPQEFAASVGVKKALLTVPVRKATRQEFVRVHPDEAYRLAVAVIDLKTEREVFLVDPTLCSGLPGEVVPKMLFTTINRQGTVLLWPVRLPGEDGRLDEWNRSAFAAAEMAMRRWIRIAGNQSLGAYEVFEATGDLPEPEWPDVTFQKLLETAFRDRFINDLNHPVLRQLRGDI